MLGPSPPWCPPCSVATLGAGHFLRAPGGNGGAPASRPSGPSSFCDAPGLRFSDGGSWLAPSVLGRGPEGAGWYGRGSRSSRSHPPSGVLGIALLPSALQPPAPPLDGNSAPNDGNRLRGPPGCARNRPSQAGRYGTPYKRTRRAARRATLPPLRSLERTTPFPNPDRNRRMGKGDFAIFAHGFAVFAEWGFGGCDGPLAGDFTGFSSISSVARGGSCAVCGGRSGVSAAAGFDGQNDDFAAILRGFLVSGRPVMAVESCRVVTGGGSFGTFVASMRAVRDTFGTSAARPGEPSGGGGVTRSAGGVVVASVGRGRRSHGC